MTSLNKSAFFLYLSWLISLVATLGSLYFSEIKFFLPCDLCWYQRIAMYPLVVILGIAAYYNDVKITKYVLPITIIGSLIALYHYMLEKIPGLASVKPCSKGIPCDVAWINWFGFITIPFLSLLAFVSITILLFLCRKIK